MITLNDDGIDHIISRVATEASMFIYGPLLDRLVINATLIFIDFELKMNIVLLILS